MIDYFFEQYRRYNQEKPTPFLDWVDQTEHDIVAYRSAVSAGVFMTFLTNSSFLYIEYFGVAPSDPITFAAVTLVLALTGRELAP